MENDTFLRKLIREQIHKIREENSPIDFWKLAHEVPDSDIPRETSYFKKWGDKIIYIEGWSDKCFSNVIDEIGDSREAKIKYAKNRTLKILEAQPYLPQNHNLKGYKFVNGKFIETPDNQVLYGVSIGVYEKI